MARTVFMNNDNDVILDPVTVRRTGEVLTDVVFSVTLKDPNGDPVSGATALETEYETETKANSCVIPGTVTLTEGSGYTLDAAATAAYVDQINIEEAPVVVVKRRQ